MSRPVFILNGPNLNRLGMREPEIYGSTTLAEVEAECRAWGERAGRPVEFRQTNHEGILVDWIQEAGERASGIVINPAAYTHTSVALHDALRTADIPAIELHISNIHAREEFRRHSFVSPVVAAVICGLGVRGYVTALEALQQMIGEAD